MDVRQKFLSVMSFDRDLECPKWEFGYWAGVLDRWYREGLPKQSGIPEWMGEGDVVRAEVLGRGKEGDTVTDTDVNGYFSLDEPLYRIPIKNFTYPFFDEEILEDHGDWYIRRDKWGVIRRQSKDRTTPEAFVGSIISTEEEWQQFKAERLNPSLPDRFPDNWDEILQTFGERTFPTVLGGSHGFYGSLRYLLGEKNVLLAFYDNPRLIHLINDYLCDFWIELYDLVLSDTSVDMGLIWEDMCYRNGPLISPAMFREFLLPYYKKLTSFFRDHGVEIIFIDSDGDVRKLIPLLIEGGVTGFYPVEITNGQTAFDIRKNFPNFQMIGGVDKKILIETKDPKYIKPFLEELVLPTVQSGGYIPTIDHLVPPDIPWEHFKQYRHKLNEMIDYKVRPK